MGVESEAPAEIEFSDAFWTLKLATNEVDFVIFPINC